MAANVTAENPASAERNPGAADPVHEVRRFMELWTFDRAFRRDLLVDAQAAARARRIGIDPEQLRILWDDDFRKAIEGLPPAEALKRVSPLGLIWIGLKERAKDARARMRAECVPKDTRLAAWRQRQIERCDVDFHPRLAETIAHIPFAIELSKGCSVGCWFCGVSAPKLDGHFPYSRDNAASFRALLKVLARMTGRRAGKWGILYWATDPFDHPDYERFCEDFAAEFGTFPVTTTAQGWKNLQRTRALARLSAAAGKPALHLSVLTLRTLDSLLSDLSPSELAAVKLIPVNTGSVVPIAQAGRARTKRSVSPPAGASTVAETSIACMSGFLINLVDQTVKLTSPCASSDRWPDGLIVYDEKRYAHADEFEAVIETMVSRQIAEMR